MANTKHPLIASDGTHTLADLISEGLECKAAAGYRYGTRDCLRWAVSRKRMLEFFDCFLIATV
jgi:hypothetical protein